MHNVYNRKQERVVIIINLEIIYIKYNTRGKFLKSIKSFFIIFKLKKAKINSFY